MGKLLYGSAGSEIFFDDRTLAHLQLVLGAKLRRHEAFFCSWRNDAKAGEGRSSIWIETSIPLYFLFEGGGRVAINRVWLDELTKSANSAQGLQIMAETDAVAAAGAGRVTELSR